MMEMARALGFRFDVVLMPFNVMDMHFSSFGRLTMPMALREGIEVITMKTFGGSNGVILKGRAAIDPIECLRYPLGASRRLRGRTAGFHRLHQAKQILRPRSSPLIPATQPAAPN